MPYSDDIDQIILDNIEEILGYFSIEFNNYGSRLSLSCPIHGSDNKDSLSIRTEAPYTWICWTFNCQDEVIPLVSSKGEHYEKARGKSLLALVRALLDGESEKDISYKDAIEWVRQLLGRDIKVSLQSKKSLALNSTKEFIHFSKFFQKSEQEYNIVNREQIRSSLNIPSAYFVDRGFSKEIIDKYDIGLCLTKNKQMYNRAVVPIYDDNHEYMIGCIGRTVYPYCKQCKRYHAPTTQCSEQFTNRKWIFSPGFNAGQHLFNYWFAKPHIDESGVVILVEGQGDVLRLEQSGYKIGLGLFGDNITPNQKHKLFQLPINNVILITDNDKAGKKARTNIEHTLKRYYNLHHVQTQEKDIGDSSVDEIQKLLDPILKDLL